MSNRKRDDRLRALYVGGHPTEKAKVIHRRFIHGPLPRLLPIVAVLQVRGRHSGNVVELPIVIIRFHGAWYIASMLESMSNW